MSRQSAAIKHLALLQVERDPSQDELYVRLAFTYGLEVHEIAAASNIPLHRIRSILGGH